MDQRKAFDTDRHGGLLDKLPAYGIKDIEMKWFTSYLFARAQVVNYQGTLLDRETITRGVPQGSILGPLLFALLKNDLPTEVTECKILLYADDTVVYFSHKNVSHLETILSEEVNKVAKWMSNNHLMLNLKKAKTESLLFGTTKRLSKESSPRINIKISGELVNGKNTRGDGCSLIVPRIKTEAGRKIFKFQGCNLFNELPKDMKSEKSIVRLKGKLMPL